MKNLILLFVVVLATSCHLQDFEETPCFAIMGQSNAVNLAIQHQESMETLLETTYWGVPNVERFIEASGASTLAYTGGQNDWSPLSVGGKRDQWHSNYSDWFTNELANQRATKMEVVFWWQGENDTTQDWYANAYFTNLEELYLHAQYFYNNTDLKFVAVQLHIDYVGDIDNKLIVRRAYEDLDSLYDNFKLVNYDDLSVGVDGVHPSPEVRTIVRNRMLNAVAL